MRIISVGEILWDVIGGSEYLGGAPFNLCAHLARLGHQAFFVSAVGCDDRGRRALERAEELGIDVRYVNRTQHAPTGISEVTLNDEGHGEHKLLRPAAYDFVQLTEDQRLALADEQPAWLCYGTLAQIESNPRLLTQQLMQENSSAKRFYDVNLRPNSWTSDLVNQLCREANAIKLNEEEASVLSGVFGLPPHPLNRFCEMASERFEFDVVCVTRGPDGCALWRNGEYVESPGFVVSIGDTVGSGDAFSAALLHGLQAGWPVREIAQFANRVGALVASRSGATPTWTLEEAMAL
ncbi:MAG TPA: carbohydrate kinase [Acidobacteriaceae bacterium]|nr:carbohydrate kinase [Acidobacteriaceae bacterium]